MAASLTTTLNPLDPEEMVVCPFDPVHRLRRKRMQYHIMKCSQNQDMREWRKCPFNAIHYVQKYEFDYHIQTCPDRGRVEVELLQQAATEGAPKLKGYTELPASDWRPPEATEDWNDDNVCYQPPVREGIFGSDSGSSHVPEPDYDPPVMQVEDPPKLRKPRPIGRGSQVYQYSLASAETRTGGRSHLQPELASGLGRGRGRGRWFGARESNGMTVSPGSMAHEQLPAAPCSSPGQVPSPSNEELAEERLKKAKRKLEKMLRQIEELEMKQHMGMKINSEQLDKLNRKEDVIAQLEKLSLQ